MAQEKKIFSKQTLGDRIRERRRTLGLTQRQLAEKVGLSPAAIGRMESERDYVSSKPTMIALAQVFGCGADWLETGKGELYGELKSDATVRDQERKNKEFVDALPHEIRKAIGEYATGSIHYKTLETLFDTALTTRGPLPDPAQESAFKETLRAFLLKRTKGREAILHALDLLEAAGTSKLCQNILDRAR